MSLMSSYKLPCGTKRTYPEKLDYMTRKGTFILFHASSSKYKVAYIVSPKIKGVEIVVEGSPDDVANLYEAINLEEHEIRDVNGVFFYKQAATKDEFEKAFEKFMSPQDQK
ncbi:hypothetical protein [Paenibacillus sp. SI8]|uniref:hypothetical protein n=1 Tax=unclassified Paenibacillus TaxID=185978 RepID=UPI0034674B80